MTSPTNLFRLPFAEDVSAGEPLNAVARHAVGATGFAATNLPELFRLQALVEARNFQSRIETLAALAEADMVLAACADGELA